MKLDVSLTHRLSQEEAVQQVKNLIEKTKKEHAEKLSEFQEEWNGNNVRLNASANGMSGSAAITVASGRISVSCELPAAAFLYKGKIKRAIEEKLTAALAKAPAVRAATPVSAGGDDDYEDGGEFIPHRIPAHLRRRVRLPKTPPLEPDDMRYGRAYCDIRQKISYGAELTDEELAWYENERKRLDALWSDRLKSAIPLGIVILLVIALVVWRLH